MDEAQVKNLFLSLMKADTGEEVISLLKTMNLWDAPGVWRFYGDNENNYSTAGNQQSLPERALTEKLVNSVDARLMNECLIRGIDPEGPSAPQSIQEAVDLFFSGGGKYGSMPGGKISTWPPSKRTEVARNITLAVTGPKPREGDFSITISDCGEGQTPDMMPETLLSLDRNNKLRIPFVQGKFNMGGTGVLKFCGRHNLQLIISRRNPQLLSTGYKNLDDQKWGFTVVRREEPKEGRRSSVYTYLAPVNANVRPGQGGVLRFTAKEMPIFPDGRDPYAIRAEWGTLIKLYEYSVPGYQSHILRKDGILSRMDLLLPDVALPIRFHECRESYRGHAGSFETTMTGIGVRLEDDKAENLEFDPSSCTLSVSGEPMTAKIFPLKKGKAETYRKHEGIIFTVNGQTHAHFHFDFFRRKRVDLRYLADSILVVVDCSRMSTLAREDLFMTSRDRLSGCDLRYEIERELEHLLREHAGLRGLKERRRREEIESKVSEEKPLEDILGSLLKRYPTLSTLFLMGRRIANPFKSDKVKEEGPFKGKRYPTFFRFKGKDYGTELHRDSHIGMRSRILFETDAVNDYFERMSDPGTFSLHVLNGEYRSPVTTCSLNLHDGIAALSMRLPDTCREGDRLCFLATVTDPTRSEPFENVFLLSVKKPASQKPGRPGKRRTRTEKDGNQQDGPAGIKLPNIREVYEPEWDSYSFDKYTALQIKHAEHFEGDGNGKEAQDIYDFFVNMDNVYLKSELKAPSKDIQITRAQFKTGMVLLGLAVLQEEINKAKRNGGDEGIKSEDEEMEGNVEDRVEHFSRSIAPILLPMIESLGSLEEEDISSVGTGEAA
jgi:hypothetical protein